jgi:Holliday junction DNA helicase RuvA
MVLELRDKLPEPAAASVAAIATMSSAEEDVLSALVNLGYQRTVAEKVLSNVTRSGSGKSFDAIFRDALATLSK